MRLLVSSPVPADPRAGRMHGFLLNESRQPLGGFFVGLVWWSEPIIVGAPILKLSHDTPHLETQDGPAGRLAGFYGRVLTGTLHCTRRPSHCLTRWSRRRWPGLACQWGQNDIFPGWFISSAPRWRLSTSRALRNRLAGIDPPCSGNTTRRFPTGRQHWLNQKPDPA